MRRASHTVIVLGVLGATGCYVHPRAEVARFLKPIARTDGCRFAVAVQDMDKDEDSWDIAGDEPFVAGDSIALFVLAELFRQAQAGQTMLDEIVHLNGHARPRLLRDITSIERVSLRDLALLAFSDGDAAATNILIECLGMPGINATAVAMGATRTEVKRKLGYTAPPENYTTARDLAKAWAALAGGLSLSPELRSALEEVIYASRKEGRTVAMTLPSVDVRVHLDGDSPGREAVAHGSGLVHLPGRLVAVAVLGEKLTSTHAGQKIASGVVQTIHRRIEEECRHVIEE